MISQFAALDDVEVKYLEGGVNNNMSPDLQTKQPYFHNLYEVLFVKVGSADFIIKGKLYHLKAGSMLFLSNLENHSIAAHSDVYSRYSILVSNKFLTTYIKSPELLSVFKHRPANFCHKYDCTAEQFEYISKKFDVINREYNNKKDFWDGAVACRIFDILASIYRVHPEIFPASNEKAGQNTVFEIQNYIVSNLSDDLTLTSIAEHFFINKFYLSHIFKEITGYNLREYIILERISKAKDMLINSSTPIKNISEGLGFNNLSHFIRTFKNMEKMPPNQYRKKVKHI